MGIEKITRKRSRGEFKKTTWFLARLEVLCDEFLKGGGGRSGDWNCYRRCVGTWLGRMSCFSASYLNGGDPHVYAGC